MCEVGNLIDLTQAEEPNNEETWFEESEDSIIPSNSFKGPYDPFDSMEKEACAKGIALKAQVTEDVSAAEAHYPDLNNESPPVCMRKDSALGETPRQRCTSSSFQKQLLKLNASRSAANLSKSKICDGSTPFERTILNENQQMLSAESPLKLVEDDELASSLKFEQDLRMLRIPMLDALSDADPRSSPEIQREDVPVSTKTEAILPATNDEELPKAKEWSQLLQRLRTLVHQVVEKTHWHLFDAIIEPIAALMGPEPNPSPSACFPEAKEDDKAAPLPYEYTRQGTFDLDLQENWTKGSGVAAVGQAEEEEEAEGALPGSKVQDFPDAMTCSAATFDGEPRLLPAAESLSLPRKEFMTELVDETLALQINELLERHKLGQSMVGDHESHGVDPRTVILLVNPNPNYSSQFKSPPSCIVQPNPIPLGVSNDADSMRRRSSSLSIHDKPKLLKEITKSGSQDENQQNVPPREVKSSLPPTSAQASFRQRRNSFSTPSNPPTKIGESRRIVLDRIKTPSINESVVKFSGGSTTRAMIPTKRVAPIVKQVPPAAAAAAETTYLNPQPRSLAAPRNSTVPETPFSRSKPAPKIFATSTPLPQMRSQQRRSLKPVAGQGLSGSAANASYATPNFRRPSFSKKPGTG